MDEPFRNQAPDADFIDFGIGWPDFTLLPQDILRRAADRRLRENDASLLNYGDNPGDDRFRTALASFLSRGYGEPVAPGNLFLTAGASQALGLLCHTFTNPGDTIFVEDRTYFLALGIFADYGLNVVAIPTDENGLSVEVLEAKLAEFDPVCLYTIPTFQNPTSVTLSQSRRERLVALSQQYNFLIIADEVYHLLDYTVTPPASLASFAASETVLSVGSFSKILGPGLRLGWIQTAPSLLARLVADAVVASGGALNHFTAGLVAVVLEQGWQDTYLNMLQDTFRRRAAALTRAIRQSLPDLPFHEPQGGYFIWLELPVGVDTGVLLETARQYKVGFQPGMKFSPDKNARNGMRLSFSFYDTAVLQTGISRLQKAIDHAANEKI